VTLPGPNLTLDELVLRDQAFWEELQDYSIEAVEEAFQIARHNLKFFPVPAQILEIIVQESNKRYQDNLLINQIDWMKPTIEGKEKARAALKSLYDRWDAEDAAEAVKREMRFKERKKELSDQAKRLSEK
jgi:hypothetical protein